MSERFDLLRASAWAATWAIGVAIGVALGGWLTVVGGAAAPGVSALDPTEDLLVLPVAAAAVTFAIHFGGQIVMQVRRRLAARDGDEQDDQTQSAEDDRIGG